MRYDSLVFQEQSARSKSDPVVVVEMSFNHDHSDRVYFTSRNVDGIPTGAGIQTFQECISKNVVTSQKLLDESFSATVGSIDTEIVDDDSGTISDFLNTKKAENKTFALKRFRVHAGFYGMDFSDFSLVQTQIVKNMKIGIGKITFICNDIQRETRNNIFELKETKLSNDFLSDHTNLRVTNSTGFEAYFHSNGSSAFAGQVVGHLKISKGSDFEIVTYTVNSNDEFTITERGSFNTIQRDWIANSDDGKSRNVKVTEYIYLEMPAAKLAYAIYTGVMYNDGHTLPDHWHLGVPAEYISTSEFTTIGNDIWDVTNDSKGVRVRFSGLKKTKGKTFIQEELNALTGCYPPILANGEIGYRRMTGVISNANVDVWLNSSNTVGLSNIEFKEDKVVNFLQVDWGFDDYVDDFKRTNFLYDPLSRLIYEDAPLKNLKFKGLASGKNSIEQIRGMFDAYRDRYAGPPFYCSPKLTPDMNFLEVGDIVGVDLPHFDDPYSSGAGFKRSAEVKQVRIDWLKGDVQLNIGGSTRRASGLSEFEGDGENPTGNAVPDAVILTGKNIESEFPGQVSRSGSIVTLTGDITLDGGDNYHGDITDCMYYVNGDFTVPSNRTIFLNRNILLKATGFINWYGFGDGVGRGKPGEDHRRHAGYLWINTATENHSTWQDRGTFWRRKTNDSYPASSDNYPDSPVAYFGKAAKSFAIGRIEGAGSDKTNYFYDTFFSNTTYKRGNRRPPASLPMLQVDPANFNDALPLFLEGIGGPAGDALYDHQIYTNSGNERRWYPVADGGDGGNGGAGLVILCRGMDFGQSGSINLSGGNGGAAEIIQRGSPAINVNAGDGGAGNNGCLYIFVDGLNNSRPDRTGNHIILQSGQPNRVDGLMPYISSYNADDGWQTAGSHWGYGDWLGMDKIYRSKMDLTAGENYFVKYDPDGFGGDGLPAPLPADITNKYLDNSVIQTLLPEVADTEEPPEITSQPLNVTLTESTNTPKTPDGNLSTIEVTVTPPTDDNYSHSIIDYRKQGDTGWKSVGIAQHEVAQTVESDGETYEFIAFAVSTTGEVLKHGTIYSITVSNFQDDNSIIRPARDVTGLKLSTRDTVETEFLTADLEVSWDFNYAGGVGFVDDWFSHFRVEFRSAGAMLLYSATTKSNYFNFNYQLNKTVTNGPFDEVMVRVYQVTKDGNESQTAAQRTFTNANPSAPSAISINPGSYEVSFKWEKPNDLLDYSHTEIYISTSTPVVIAPSNLKGSVQADSATIGDLDPETTYYFAMRNVDVFGNYSNAISASFVTTGINWDDLTNLPLDLWEGGNLIPATRYWNIGTSDSGVFDAIGNDQNAENVRVIDDGPFGNQEVIWQCIPDSGNNADGGWNTSVFSINRNKTYIFGVYVNKADTTGALYFGCLPDAVDLVTTGETGNPYFFSTNLTGDLADEWLLAIGVVHNSDYSGPQSGLTGLYRVSSGQKVASGVDFKSTATASLQQHRAYHYYNTTGDGSTVKQRFARPFVVESSSFPGIDSLTLKLSNIAASATRNLVFRQPAMPIGENSGDIWIDTDDNNKLYYFNGTNWLDSENLRIQQAIDAAAGAQSTADGKITTYYQANSPGSASVGDLWIDTDDDVLHRYNGTSWEVTRDSGIFDAINDAANAQTTADGKIETYFQNNQPSIASDGDLWIETDANNRMWRYDGSAWQDARDGTIAIAQAAADSKAYVYYQTSAPSGTLGDLWIDTDNNNRLHRHNGSSWDAVDDTRIATALSNAATAQATADGKIETFFQSSIPGSASVGDLWFDTDDNNAVYRYNGSTWTSAKDSEIAQALSDAANAQSTADGKITTYYAATGPGGASLGDLWVDTSDGNELHRHNGTSWVSVKDSDITLALSNAANAQSTADGKIESFYQATAPSSGMSLGDLWFDTNDNNSVYRYNGSAWESAKDGQIATALSNATNAQATADGKVTTFFSTTQPTADASGDLWFNSDNNLLKRWNGSVWADVSSLGADWNSNIDNKPGPDQIGYNYLDFSLLDVGDDYTGMADGDWEYAGNAGTNEIVADYGPFGEMQKIWRIQTSGSLDDGGFGYTIFGDNSGGVYNFSTDYSYRFTCYAYVSEDETVEILLFGLGYSLKDSGGSTTTSMNRFFDSVTLPVGKWVLVCFVLHSEHWNGTESGLTGIYDVETGEKLSSGSEFSFDSAQIASERERFRFINQIRNVDSGYAYICNPKFERITDSTVPLMSLMGAADNTQNQINEGNIRGFDYYNNSDNYFLRIHPSMMNYLVTTSSGFESSSHSEGAATIRVSDGVPDGAVALCSFQEEQSLVIGAPPSQVPTKFKCRIAKTYGHDYSVNRTLSIGNGRIYRSETSPYDLTKARGFGFLIDHDGNIYGFCGTYNGGSIHNDSSYASYTVSMGLSFADIDGDARDNLFEAVFDPDSNTVEFIITRETAGDTTGQIITIPQGETLRFIENWIFYGYMRKHRSITETQGNPYDNIRIGQVLYERG